MNEKRCLVCGKELPLDFSGDKCSLCAIGLTPQPEATDAERSNFFVEGRTLAGVECQICHADLTLADLRRGNCAICGSIVPAAHALDISAVGPLHHEQVVTRPAQEPSSGVRTWPDDAPLW